MYEWENKDLNVIFLPAININNTEKIKKTELSTFFSVLFDWNTGSSRVYFMALTTLEKNESTTLESNHDFWMPFIWPNPKDLWASHSGEHKGDLRSRGYTCLDGLGTAHELSNQYQ